jgi:hypothetical protein
MFVFRPFSFALLTSFALAALPAQAALIDAGQFSGNDCDGGAFANCKATTTGVGQLDTGSPVIYKFGSDASTESGSFGAIDGSEFSVSFNGTTHVLSWTYAPGAGDPEIHYFDIKQANSYHLYYDLVNPITSFTLDLDDIGYNGFSHVTWFDTGSTPPGGGIPEPMTLGLLGAALMGLGMAAHRRRAAR